MTTSAKPSESDRAEVAALAEEIEALLHRDPARAGQLVPTAVDAARQAGARDLEARVSYAHARLRAERGELDAALELIAEARRLWLADGRPLQAARTDLGRMQILDDLGRHREALVVGELLQASLADAAASEDDATLAATIEAAVLGNMGVAQSFLGHHDESLRCYEESERRYAELGLAVQVAQQRANRGIELLALGRAREALSVMAEAEREFRAAGDPLWAAKCATHLAEAQMHTGALVDALRALDRARSELAALGATAEEVRVHLQLGRLQLEAGLLPEAAESARQALRLAEAASLTHDAAFARLTLAAVHLRAHRLVEAEEESLAAAWLFDQIGDEQYHARADLVSAQVAAAHGDPRAPALLAAAAAALGAGGWNAPRAWALLLQSDLADETARGALLDQAAHLVAELGTPSLVDGVAVRRADAARRAGRLDDAVGELRATVARVDLHGPSHVDPLLRVATRTDATAAHDALVHALVTRGRDEDVIEALVVSDSAKAQTLRDLRAGSRRSVPVQSGDDFRDDLSATYSALEHTLDSRDRAALWGRVQQLEARIGTQRLGQALRDNRRPRAADAGATAHGSLAQVSPTLAYHVSGADVVCFAVVGGQVTTSRLTGATTRVDELLRGLAGQWSRFDLGRAFTQRHAAALEDSTRRILADLYDVLLRPVQEWLDDVAAAGMDELTVVPHKALHHVPFAALYDGTAAVLEHWTLSLSPTVRSVAGPPPDVPRAGAGLLIVTVPDEQAPMVAVEADRILAVVPDARVLAGDQATAAALKAALPGPGHVHLACHGLHRPDNPMFSALRLADGWFSCTDLLDLDLDGALLTLSACESGESGIHAAEPLGLAWAGLAAGARGVVVSQRVLDDEGAAELMSTFHAELSDGASPAAALRTAQRAMAVQNPHPYHWASLAFVATPSHRLSEPEIV